MDGMDWNTAESSETAGTIEYSVQNPTTFITGVSPGYTWLHVANLGLWSNTKTIYDPCPAGWKVAESHLGSNIKDVEYTVENNCVKLSYDRSGTNYAFYPLSGRLNFTTAAYEQEGAVGYIWSSNVAGNGSSYGFYFDVNSTLDLDFKFYPSQGSSVRCQKIG